MTTVKRIQLAEDELAEIQRAIGTMQTGLQNIEAVAAAAETMWNRSARMMQITLGLVGASILVLFWSRRRSDDEE